ncbi:putative Na+/H+ antiporter [Luteolibacter sp. SL250]|uniref:putative Na+/H+ antiporter n=1 Tax=Luteolibacter sp. SL250 TaxID=2995170 RepID=UPI00226DEBD1|nr:putative Na+/H+ antiporter [Luteolibacter sp. SL250]WAC18742.1 putative Na+/H+ antiporter [Luteolibacter sp. SL250]
MTRFILLISLLFSCSLSAADPAPAYPNLSGGIDQYAVFPRPLEMYPTPGESLVDTIMTRASMDPFNVAATVIFLLAIAHTFLAGPITRLAHHYEHLHEEKLEREGYQPPDDPDASHPVCFRATILHFFGEVEAIFGIWVLALAGAATWFHSWTDFKLYMSKDRVFTEPLFVVVVMAIAASRPVLRFSEKVMSGAASLGKGSPGAWWLSVMIIAPLLGSFITEPAAMTIGALLLAKKFYRHNPPAKLAYATLGLLFVNISVGGTLTHFAAPPVLMVAGKWQWDTPFMLLHFGWKSALGILISTTAYFLWFKKEFFRIADKADGREDGRLNSAAWAEREDPVPAWIVGIHLAFLAWTVYSAHYPVLFIGGFLFFLAFTIATRHHQNDIQMKGPLLVGFFLAGLVIHGGCQGWWISPVITSLPDPLLMLGATILTAFNDNAAITYLAAQVDGISEGAKYAVVAGAVAGGGLTVIANAPNPAGQSILGRFFEGGVSPLKLFLAAVIPTIVVYVCLALLPS